PLSLPDALPICDMAALSLERDPMFSNRNQPRDAESRAGTQERDGRSRKRPPAAHGLEVRARQVTHRHRKRSEIVHEDQTIEVESLPGLRGRKLPDVIRHSNDIPCHRPCNRERALTGSRLRLARSDLLQIVLDRADNVGIVRALEDDLSVALLAPQQRETRIRAADVGYQSWSRRRSHRSHQVHPARDKCEAY